MPEERKAKHYDAAREALLFIARNASSEPVPPAVPLPAKMLTESARRLGLELPVSRQQVQAAWKERVLKHHPDRGGSPHRIKAINVARDVLMKVAR